MAIVYGNLGFLRTIVFDLLFGIYILLVEPLILPELRNYANRSDTQSSLLIGFLIIGALIAEVPGIFLKFRAIGEKMLKAGLGKPGQRIDIKKGVFLFVIHTAIGVSVAFFAFRAFGLDFHRDENVFRVCFLAALAREGIIIYLLFAARVPEGRRPLAFVKNFLGDACLFIFGTIAFTATWRVVMPGKSLRSDTLMEMVLTLFFASILFLIYYLSCNMATVYDNFLTARSRKQVLYRLGSLVLVVATAMYPLFRKTPSQGRALSGASISDEIEKRKAEEKILQERILKRRN
jgi:hypothetical protein